MNIDGVLFTLMGEKLVLEEELDFLRTKSEGNNIKKATAVIKELIVVNQSISYVQGLKIEDQEAERGDGE